MTPELHARAVEIFAQAIEIENEAERRSWVGSVCAYDPVLARRVLDMLAADGTPGLSAPAIHVAADLVADGITLQSEVSNTRLGAYLIGDPIGAGGMGTVYEARDVRLDRKVALKILPSRFVPDRERVQRFRQEARAASLLNHPNIVSIYDAGFDQGRHYIATEFIEGKTLRELLAAGPIEFARVIDVAVQMCSALVAAHQAGIIHRDIKPENVMLRPDGIVKVLDFGLAKLTEQSAASLLETAAGAIAGTGPYVSPEQLTGMPATSQSDLFSVGVVLYELATGTRPFTGATQVAVGSAILHEHPVPPSSVVAALTPDFDAVVLRALEKDPELRYQTAADLRAGLRLLARGSSSLAAGRMPPAAPKAPRPIFARGVITGAGAMALLAAALWLLVRPSIGPLPNRFVRLTEAPGEEIFANLTPDGRQFIYTSAERGKWDIYMQRVGGRTATNLTLGSTAGDREPALSRDGSRIAFRSERDGGGLFVMEATGENPVRVALQGHLPAWSPDGKSIVFSDDSFITPNVRSAPTSRLHILELATGNQRQLNTGDAVQPNWSPHAYRIAYWGMSAGGRRDIYTIGADPGSGPVAVTADQALDWNPVWSPDGVYLYFISDRGGSMNVWRVPMNERTGRAKGAPEPVTTPAAYVKSLAFPAGGSRFVYSASASRVNLYSIDFDPVHLEAIGRPVLVNGAHSITNFKLSPDGASIVYDTLADSAEEIWIERLDGSERRRLISDNFRNRVPVWSPKGDEIVFYSNRAGSYDEWLIRVDGSGLRPLTAVREDGMQSATWLDRNRILASRESGDLVLLDSKPQQPASHPAVLPGASALGPITIVDSPRGSLIIGYTFTHGVDEELVTYTYPPGRFERLGVSGRHPQWLRVSPKPRLIFIRDTACYLYDMETRREKRLFSVAPNRIFAIQVAPDGHRIWFSQTIREADVWMGEMKDH